MSDQKDFWANVTDSTPERLANMSPEVLQAFHSYFLDVRAGLRGNHMMYETCRDRIDLLRSEIELRRIQASSANQHKETLELGTKTFGVSVQGLNWAKIAGIAAIVSVLLSVIALIVQIFLSTSRPSTFGPASPASSLQTPTPKAVSPEPAAIPSIAISSPLPTAQASPSPILPSPILPSSTASPPPN